jgi:hypothetical protein
MNRRILKCSDEYECFSKFRSVVKWGKGEIKKIKRRYHKRDRREAKKEILEELNERI